MAALGWLLNLGFAGGTAAGAEGPYRVEQTHVHLAGSRQDHVHLAGVEAGLDPPLQVHAAGADLHYSQ